ncbi:MAG: histidine kinase dimerization/phosphoacceptor domain -containing protein [Hyphomonadaceae bacterium]|nr:histidine kinase dimerization/phosphoacceptor domain -containing protein [Hyphomonadaceae bacterium]
MTTALKPRTTRPGGIRAAISLLLLIPILVPLFAAALIWLSERDASRASEDRVLAAARIVSANVRNMVTITLDRLRRMDEALGPDPLLFAPRPGAPGEGLTQLYDATGTTLMANGQRGANVANNPAFVALAGGDPWTITPLLGQAGALRFFGIARRIERNGQFAGVITALLPADSLSEVWSEVSLGVESTVGVIRDDGALVTRYPVPAEGVNLASFELFTIHLPKSADGVYVSAASPVDRIPRIVGYQSLKDLGLIVTASRSRAETADAFWNRVGSTALVAAPVFIVMVALCGWAIMLLLRHERSRVALEVALDQNRMLFQEIHHRVKNNLQQVAALVKLQQAPAQMKEDLIRRIAAMSAVHQHIYESDQFGALDAEGYLAKLLAGLRDSAPPGVDLDWRLDPLTVSPDQALPLGLIVNEVVANAFKHGFPDGKAGRVSVTLERPLPGSEALLTIADTGVGMAEIPSGGLGLGTRLIAGLTQQLEGKSTATRDNGVRFELRFPVGGG